MQTERNIWLRVLSMILTLALLISCVPNQVYALAGEALADLLEATDTAVLQPNATPNPVLSTAHIVAEDASRRGETYKEYILNNGLHLATVYPSAVHYEENGVWKDIDNTLVAAVFGGKAVYQNAAGAWSVRFPRNMSTNDMVGITKDGHTVQFGMAGELRSTGDVVVASVGQIGATADTLAVSNTQTATAQIQQIDLTAARAAAEHPETVLEKLNSRLSYANVYPNTNVVYDLQGNQLKESVVLQRYDADLWGYRYALDTGDLVPVLREDQQIDLCHPKTSEVILTMPAPYMLDNNGETSYDVEVALTRNGSNYLLSYYLPREWLAEADRAWPVILDPVVQFPGLYTNMDDITVGENYNEAMGRAVIQCGYYGPIGAMRMYMQFIELPPITVADVIVDATIRMNKPYDSDDPANISVHKVTESWSQETISWTNQPDFDTNIEDYVVCQPAGHYTWNITSIVSDWYETANYGMVFKAPEEVENAGVDNWKQFYSSEFNLDTYYIPLLTIAYQNHNGLEDYWSYSSASAGRAGTGYVNLFTGNLTWVRGDLGFDGNRMPVSISHVYNSNDSQRNDFGMGFGWRTNYNQTITYSNGVYTWEDGDGTRHEFITQNGVISDVDGLRLTLTVTGTDDYVLTDVYGNFSEFTDGKLTRMANNLPETETDQTEPEDNENQGPRYRSEITISYDSETGFISQIADGVGRVYQFHYQSNLLNKISYRGTGSTELTYVQYTYEGQELISIEDKKPSIDAEAFITAFDYDDGDDQLHLITKVTDTTGYNVVYTYFTGYANRVDFVREYNDTVLGEFMSFEYSTHYTRTRDHKAYETYYQFNDWGNLVAVHDSDGHTQYTKYALNDVNDPIPNTAEAHQIIEVFDTGDATNNILYDSSFEGDYLWETYSTTIKAEISTKNAYQGKKSMKISVANEITASSSWTYVEPGETYTFSAYILPEHGAIVTVTLDPVGSEPGESNTLEVETDGWIRIQVSYTNEDAEQKTLVPRITVTSGTAYIDCVQLEKADAASNYSAMENGDVQKRTMDGIVSFRGWTASETCTENDNHHKTSTGTANTSLDDGVLRIIGDPEKIKFIAQPIAGSGDAGDVFVLSGWAQASAVPYGVYRDPNWPETHADEYREFGLKLVFNHGENGFTEHFVSFDSNISDDCWQYTAATIIAPAPYLSVSVQVVYSHQVGVAYFDGIQLYKNRCSTTYTYNEYKNLIGETNILGQTTTYTYDEVNEIDLVGVNAPVGSYIIYVYDDFHNIIKMVEQSTAPDGIIYRNSYEYEYNQYGNVISTLLEQENSVLYSEPLRQKSTTSYTSNCNYISSITNTDNETTYYGYDPETGVLLWVQYPGDTAATRTEYTYDNMYRLIETSTTPAQNTEMSARYTYHKDLLATITTGSNTTYTITYGDFNLRKSVRVGNRSLATYHYSHEDPNASDNDKRNHNLERLDYGNGDSVEYTYDYLGRVKSEIFREGETSSITRIIEYAYTNTGAIARMTDSATGMETICDYDSAGRVATILETNDENYWHVVAYVYDNNGNIIDVQESFLRFDEDTYDDSDYPILANTLSYKYLYDYKNRLAAVLTDHATKEYQYDGLDRLAEEIVSKVVGNTSTPLLSNRYTYETYEETSATDNEDTIEYTGNRISQVETEINGVTTVYSYTYDANGNITSISDGTNTTTYVYDAANQLVRENNQAAGKTWRWTYDNAGNILSKEEFAYTTGTLGTDDDPIEYGYDSNIWGDLLTSYDGKSFQYDGVGNLTNDGTWTYTWKQGRQLASMFTTSETWNFEYDANGMRTKRYEGNNIYTYVYNGSQLTAMTFPFGKMLFTYDAAGRPLTLEYHNAFYCQLHSGGTCASYCETYYYVTNLQGDVIALLDSSGDVDSTYTYDAWGNLIECSESMIGRHNPLRYRGYVYDWETKLYYLQSRYYNPEIGRFISADAYVSTGQGILGNNMFAYCNNNPVNYSDPTGHSAILIALAIGAVLGGIYGGISAAANDQNIVAGIAIGIVVGGLTGLITEVATVPLMLLGTFAVGAAGDVASQMILDGKSLGDVNLISVGLTGVANAGLALVGKGLSQIDSMAGLKGAEKVAFGAITNSPLLGMGMALNMIFSQNFGVYTVNDLIDDLSGPKYELAW